MEQTPYKLAWIYSVRLLDYVLPRRRFVFIVLLCEGKPVSIIANKDNIFGFTLDQVANGSSDITSATKYTGLILLLT